MRDSATVEATVSVVVKLVEMKASDEGLNTPPFFYALQKRLDLFIFLDKRLAQGVWSNVSVCG